MRSALLVSLVLSALVGSAFAEDMVSSIPEPVRREFKLAPFYQKCLLIEGFPIVASEKANDAAVSSVQQICVMLAGERHRQIENPLAAGVAQRLVRHRRALGVAQRADRMADTRHLLGTN